MSEWLAVWTVEVAFLVWARALLGMGPREMGRGSRASEMGQSIDLVNSLLELLALH